MFLLTNKQNYISVFIVKKLKIEIKIKKIEIKCKKRLNVIRR